MLDALEFHSRPSGWVAQDEGIQLHPVLVELLDSWRASHDSFELLITDDGRPLDRHHVGRIVRHALADLVGAAVHRDAILRRTRRGDCVFTAWSRPR